MIQLSQGAVEAAHKLRASDWRCLRKADVALLEIGIPFLRGSLTLSGGDDPQCSLKVSYLLSVLLFFSLKGIYSDFEQVRKKIISFHHGLILCIDSSF
jgi:hypothetical protein